jgi:hypothetical protein
MEWAIIGILGVVVFWLIKLYRVGLEKNVALANVTLLLVLEEEYYVTLKNAFIQLAASAQAKNAAELGLKAFMAINNVASVQKPNTLLVTDALWKVRIASLSSSL